MTRSTGADTESHGPVLVGTSGDALPPEGRTLIETWLDGTRLRPDAPAFYTDETGWVSHAALRTDSARVAGRFRADGLAPGSRVLFSARSSYALVVAHVAALRARLVVVPANTAYRERELAHIAMDADIAAAVVDDDDRMAWVEHVVPTVLKYDPGFLLGSHDDKLPNDDLDSVEAADPALICYTSGTTGAPKGASLTHANVLASSWSVGREWEWTEGDRLILCLPLFHVHGLAVGIHGVLYAGGAAVLQPGFSADAVIDAIGDQEATMFFGVPTMYERLTLHDRCPEFAKLRLCVSGSAPLSTDTWNRFREKTGLAILERYGMTETLMLTSNPGSGARRPGTVGRPLPGVQIQLSGETGSPGEILARGPAVFSGYWRDDAATAESFTDAGWFRTGDMGVQDSAGYLQIVGRAKELIITGGFNVYPREVEDVVKTHPDVVDAAVVGRPDEEWGESVVAFVVLKADRWLDTKELDTFIATRLASFKRPREWVGINELPRNALGKVMRSNLLM